MTTQRQNDISNLIVELFTQTHEPVGSKTLQVTIDSSSATIRSDMAKLEKLGLLEKARASSGRMLSAAGFKYFVERSPSLDNIDEYDTYQAIKAFGFEAFELDDILQKASQVLADMTGYTSMILDAEPAHQKLTAFDIVQLPSHDALTVLTLDESKPATIQFATPKNFMLKDLVTLKEVVDERLLGRTVVDIHYKLQTEILQILQKYFTVIDNVLDLSDYTFAESFKGLVFVAGKANPLDHANPETYRLLDNDQRVMVTLRSSVREDEIATVQVADSQETTLANVTVLTHKFLIPYCGFGFPSLIGPIDMDYHRGVSSASVIGRVLAMKLGDYHHYLNNSHYEVS